MATDDPWGDFEVVGEAPPVAGAPGRITIGPPPVKEPKEPPSGFRWAADGVSLEKIPGGPADKSGDGNADPKLREDESKSSFLATNLAGALGTMANAIKQNPAAAQPSLGNKLARDWLGEWANYVTGPQRQQVEAAQRLAIDNALTLGTGAAYNKEQLEGYYQGYIPAVGDDESTIKSKGRAFRLLLQAAKNRAGNAAPQIDEALKAVGFADTGSFEDNVETALTLPGLPPRDRLALANTLAEQSQRPINQEDAVAAAASGTADTVQDSSLLSEAGGQIANVAAGIGEGIVALPDMLAKGAGQLMALPADLLGFEGAANEFRNTPQIGQAIERAVPVPQDWNGWLARQASRLEGGVLGFPAKVGNALAETVTGTRGIPPRPPGNALAPETNKQIASDARSLGIEPMPAHTGGPFTRIMSAGVAQTPGGAYPMISGVERVTEQGANALRNIAQREGRILNAESTGDLARRSALGWRESSRRPIAALYDDAAEAAGDVRVEPSKVIAKIDENLAEFAETPGSTPNASFLKDLRDDLVQRFTDGVTVRGMRGMRTQLRDKFYSQGLRGTDIERRVNAVVDEASEDIANSLTQAGKSEAATLYRQADAAWKQRIETLDEYIMPIIGKRGEKSGKEVTKALQAAAQTNGNKLHRFMRDLPMDAAGDIRASVLSGLGKAPKGLQDDTGEAFSFNTLLSNWTEIPDSARKALFAEGDRAAMDKLARFSNRVRQTQRFTNFSNTSGAVAVQSLISGIGFGVGGPGGAVATTAASLPTQFMLGKALSSPGVANWLARVSDAKTGQAALRLINAPPKAALQNPAAANDVLGLQQYLARSLQSPATSAAAKEQEDVR